MSPPLLPSGLSDVLPPLAAGEFRLVHHFLKNFMGFGYQPVIPPLAEFASSLLGGQGEATAHHSFRFNDPLSAQILCLRADMTGQIARIAGGSLGDSPRPLRLCYAGYTLRTAAEALKTRRQHTQVGLERFGENTPRATAEVLAISVQALAAIGMQGITVDLHFPSVLSALLAPLPTTTHDAIRDAVRLKDTARLQQLGAPRIAELVSSTGTARGTLATLSNAPEAEVRAAATACAALLDALEPLNLAAHFTLDLLDLSGYGYYTGIGYALYWNTGGIEVGRGGCYRTESQEDAVGFTLYINDLLDKLPVEAPAPVVTLPFGTAWSEIRAYQERGSITVLV